MKTLQKGFSLVELLVVVAIIGVLAGVGIVGYQGYTDSAKERVAIANFNSVKRFVETELTLLNNNIQTTSAAINAYSTNCAGTTTAFDNTANNAANNLGAFLQGIQCYFEITNGYGSAFKNPYDANVTSEITPPFSPQLRWTTSPFAARSQCVPPIFSQFNTTSPCFNFSVDDAYDKSLK